MCPRATSRHFFPASTTSVRETFSLERPCSKTIWLQTSTSPLLRYALCKRRNGQKVGEERKNIIGKVRLSQYSGHSFPNIAGKWWPQHQGSPILPTSVQTLITSFPNQHPQQHKDFERTDTCGMKHPRACIGENTDARHRVPVRIQGIRKYVD